VTTQTPPPVEVPTPVEVRDAWDAIADGFDRYTTPRTLAFGEHVLSRLPLRPGARVLDVGCGSGGLAIPAARMGAEVVAVDIAPTMIERLTARARAEGLSTLRARVGDGTALDLEDDSFDIAVSLNGVSLFPDLSGGLAELLRVTRAGGTVAIITFGPLPQVEFIAFFLGALRATVPDAVPTAAGPLPPFRLADPSVFERTLRTAGLRDVSVATVPWETSFASVDDLLDVVMTSNPIAGRLTGGLSDEQFDQVRQVLDGMLRERSGGLAGAVLRAQMRVGRGIV
jgi:ubiquinone/menaquinone biosynthesis C-methylase UbiE